MGPVSMSGKLFDMSFVKVWVTFCVWFYFNVVVFCGVGGGGLDCMVQTSFGIGVI